MYEQQIANGMAWLDEQYPGWEQRIDLQRLDLGSCVCCVLGQVCGSYGCVVDVCGPQDRWWAFEHGFAIAATWISVSEFGPLTTEWRVAIQRRRDVALPDPTTAPWWADGLRETVSTLT